MSLKENRGNRNAFYIKPEPEEARIAPLAQTGSWQSEQKPVVKPEPSDATRLPADAPVVKPDPGAAQRQPLKKDASLNESVIVPRSLYKVYGSAEEIQYAPEDALKEGLNMVKALKASLKKVDLGSKMRADVWQEEIKNLLNQGAPTTMIAVCGATGAGKSSILNAILDDNIVPTSGMRACTAVVTEIAYHKKKTIDGDVSFLTEQEWREELAVLLDDLVDEDGYLKRSTDLRTDAGVAWSKVHAVYPSIDQEQLARMTVDQIINRDPKIAKLLGTTKHISAPDSKTFGKEISKYIDSKDQKRGDKKDKKKDKEKKDDGPAYWPLIRQVRVWCNAKALSTGAILVDLPGVADANAARNNIAKDYMKKCDCVWILAPITRAVDDKTARDLMGDAFKMQLMMDGNYDANAITFIATKCDDISCSEVIRALNLDDDSELEAIEEEIDRCKTETDEWKAKKAEAEAAAHDVNEQLKHSRDILKEHEEHLKALETGAPFEPKLTATVGKAKKLADDASAKSNSDSDSDSESDKDDEDEEPQSKKRKNKSGDKHRPAKKRKPSAQSDKKDDAMDVDEDDDFEVEDELTFSDDDEDMDKQDEDKDSSDSDSGSDSDSDKGSEKGDADEDDDEEEVTPEILKTKIDEVKQAIKDGRVQLSAFRQQRKDAVDMLATLKKKQIEAQRRKNAFCSLKRSEFSRDVLKEDFRTGLKDLDDAEQEQKNPDTFDPTVNIRDYNAIDLPVFTCSARDYVRIKGQVKGDGDPTCFTKVDDTGIPALQQWCHQLTVSSRSRAARNFLTHLNTFAKNVRIFLQGVGEVTEADRLAMKDQWESFAPDDDDRFGIASSDGPWADYGDLEQDRLYTLPQTKVGPDGEPVGVAPRLRKEFDTVVDECVEELQERFKDGLEEKCQVGAINAASAAVETSDHFAAGMHWATYRATLRRHGTWRQDLNVELTNPFTRQIASSWSKVFESDLFASFEKATMDVINRLIADVEASAAPGLKERAKGQGELCLEEARVALRKTLDAVSEAMNTQQKEISRCLAPHVQSQLADGYNRAMEERGRGSVARQKAVFHNHIESVKGHVFNGAADLIMDRLAGAATAVGEALDTALNDLAMKIEVSIAVLWEGVRDDPEQVRARAEVVETVSEILQQVEYWRAAEGMSRALATYTNA